MISFSTANLLIGVLTNLDGLEGSNYFCSGSLVFTILYFIYNNECSKRNSVANLRKRKVLLRTWDNQFDWKVLCFCIISAGGQICTYLSIILCYKYSHKAGLNIGIAQAIWALNPFMVALQEKVVYGVQIKSYQVAGMLLIVACSVLVSLSELFSDKAQYIKVEH